MINENSFTSKAALQWFEEGKRDSGDLSDPELEGFLEGAFAPAPPRPAELFLESNLAVFEQQIIPCTGRDPWILYVESDENKAFETAVIPRTMFLAHGKQVVGIEGGNIPDDLDPKHHFALVILDAGSLTEKRFRDILRCEEWEPISKLLTNTKLEVLFHIHRVHDAKENLSCLMTSFLDGRFCNGALNRSENTTVVLSGVWNQPKLSNVIASSVTNRACVMGVL